MNPSSRHIRSSDLNILLLDTLLLTLALVLNLRRNFLLGFLHARLLARRALVAILTSTLLRRLWRVLLARRTALWHVPAKFFVEVALLDTECGNAVADAAGGCAFALC
jgi:hypothetical protein